MYEDINDLKLRKHARYVGVKERRTATEGPGEREPCKDKRYKSAGGHAAKKRRKRSRPRESRFRRVDFLNHVCRDAADEPPERIERWSERKLRMRRQRVVRRDDGEVDGRALRLQQGGK